MGRIRDVPKRKRLSQGRQAWMAGRNPKQSGIICNWIGCMMFYLLVSAVLYIMAKELGLWLALALTGISYPLMVLIIATILRMRGDISESNFLKLVLEGFKITNLLKIMNGQSNEKIPDNSSRYKKS